MSGTKGTHSGRPKHGNTGLCSHQQHPCSRPCTTAAHFARRGTPASRVKRPFNMCSGSQGPRGPVLEDRNTGSTGWCSHQQHPCSRPCTTAAHIARRDTPAKRFKPIFIMCSGSQGPRGPVLEVGNTGNTRQCSRPPHPVFPAAYDRYTLRQAVYASRQL